MSKKVQLNVPAPDFELQDFNGRSVRLSDFQGKKQVVVNIDGIASYVHYGKAMSDIPSNEEILAMIEETIRL